MRLLCFVLVVAFTSDYSLAEGGFSVKTKKGLDLHDNSEKAGVNDHGVREVYERDLSIVEANRDRQATDMKLPSEDLRGNLRKGSSRDYNQKEEAASDEAKKNQSAAHSLGSRSDNDLDEQSEVKPNTTTITSKAFSLNSKNRTFLYKGDVVVIQPDMKLTCKELIGAYGEDSKISKMEAIGDVVIYKENMVATGNRGVYVAKDRTLDLTENPSVTQDGSVLHANKIRVFLETGLSQAVGEVRVEVIEDE